MKVKIFVSEEMARLAERTSPFQVLGSRKGVVISMGSVVTGVSTDAGVSAAGLSNADKAAGLRVPMW